VTIVSSILYVELVQIIIEFPPQSLNDGKHVTVEENDSNDEQPISGNLSDLYTNQPSSEDKNIHIRIAKQALQRGTTILIEKDHVSVQKSDEYQKQQSHRLFNNQFAKRDHLQSKRTCLHISYDRQRRFV
jgi:hypothetical protein